MRTLILIATMLAGCGAPIDFPDDVPAFDRGAVVVVRSPEHDRLVFECGPEAVTVDPNTEWQAIIMDCGEVIDGKWGAPTVTAGNVEDGGREISDDAAVGWVRYTEGVTQVLAAWDVR